MPEGRPPNTRSVLVAQSYFLSFDPKLKAAGQPAPPLGSLICASVLREKGFDVSFFDAMLASSESECAAAMDKAKPKALVIFEDHFNYLSKMCLDRMREAAVRMIAMARSRGVDVILAGSDASDHPGFFLRAGASAVATGEGEYAVAEWLSRSGSSEPVPGVSFLGTDAEVSHGPARPPVIDVDGFPSPAWDLVDIDAYRRLWTDRHGYFSLPLATSRGCPFHCNWCAKPIWGQRYNAMTPGRAALEVRMLKDLGAGHVNVLDDIFGLRPGWLDEFVDALIKLDAVLPFRCLSRADLLDEARIKALARAGCDMVWIGAESGSQKILDAMEKGTTVSEIKASAWRLRAAGIKVGFFIQFGYPGETDEDIEATLALIEDVRPDDIGVSVSYPLPGTPFHARVEREIGGSRHWRDSSDLAMLFAGSHGTSYYRWLHTHAHARFRMARAKSSGNTIAAVRHGLTRVVSGAVLAFAGRFRARARALPPGLSREAASRPGFGPTRRSDS